MVQSIAAARAARTGLRRALIGGVLLGLVTGAALAAVSSLDLFSGTQNVLSIEKKPEMIIIDPRSRYSSTRIV
ncbi:hypothetical protein [Rhodoligotrophos ferricapiens]|uniref:hypothetical protein n=1 Tax=Rhodoligotrophos ferricapiens TaxID=3069264 RepID=UPI00315DC5DD